MGCNCGQQRVINPEHAASMANQNVAAAVYIVVAPDGSQQTFDRYIDAAIARRQNNGQLRTTTG